MTIKNQYVKYGMILLLSISLILFTQSIKLIVNPESTPVTGQTFIGLASLWTFSMIGIFISQLMKYVPFQIIRDFPILGWVSITSLAFCLIFDFFVTAIQAVDFLSITTPVLAFAGVSVANRMVDLRRTSWKIAIVAIFVFSGTYIGSALIAQLGLFLTNN